MMRREGILQALHAGLLPGAHYGLMCVGLSLIFGVMGVINFAQGDSMMLGMHAALAEALRSIDITDGAALYFPGVAARVPGPR